MVCVAPKSAHNLRKARLPPLVSGAKMSLPLSSRWNEVQAPTPIVIVKMRTAKAIIRLHDTVANLISKKEAETLTIPPEFDFLDGQQAPPPFTLHHSEWSGCGTGVDGIESIDTSAETITVSQLRRALLKIER